MFWLEMFKELHFVQFMLKYQKLFSKYNYIHTTIRKVTCSTTETENIKYASEQNDAPRTWPLTLTTPSPYSVSDYLGHAAGSPAVLLLPSVHASETWQRACLPAGHGTQLQVCH